METTPQMVRQTLAKLRELPPIPVERRLAALEKLWQRAPLAPPQETGQFPWAQVHRGIAALAASAPHCSEPGKLEKPGVLALILAGNTPLLAWPALHYCVLLGISVFIKQSRHETIWTRHFVETLAEIDPEIAAFLHLDLFPGDDPRTYALVQSADAVIAYGSDATIAALREATPEATPFQGFGHAISVALFCTNEESNSPNMLRRLAWDVVTYGQAGCLSAQALFFKGTAELGYGLGTVLAELLQKEFELFDKIFLKRDDPSQCRQIREERDLALMNECQVYGDEQLRWTLIVHPKPCQLTPPFGLSILNLIPLDCFTDLGNFLGIEPGRLSSVGVTLFNLRLLSDELRILFEAQGVSRICRAGEMQTPPLDWRNGGVDLRAWLEKSLAS